MIKINLKSYGRPVKHIGRHDGMFRFFKIKWPLTPTVMSEKDRNTPDYKTEV